MPSPLVTSSDRLLTLPPASLPGVSSGVSSRRLTGKPCSSGGRALISATFTSCVPLLSPPLTVRMMSTVVDAPGQTPAGSSPADTQRRYRVAAYRAPARVQPALNVKPLGM